MHGHFPLVVHLIQNALSRASNHSVCVLLKDAAIALAHLRLRIILIRTRISPPVHGRPKPVLGDAHLLTDGVRLQRARDVPAQHARQVVVPGPRKVPRLLIPDLLVTPQLAKRSVDALAPKGQRFLVDARSGRQLHLLAQIVNVVYLHVDRLHLCATHPESVLVLGSLVVFSELPFY